MERGNKYDNVILDIERLFSEFASDSQKVRQFTRGVGNESILSVPKSIMNRYITGLTYALKIRHRLLYANLVLDWFFEFRDYWVHFLGNRPISVHDFHYLRNEYRKRYQGVALSGNSHEDHLKSWQDYRNIYSIFGSVWNSTFTDLIIYRYAKYIKRNSLVCEFGCGIAPITYSFLKYYPEKKLTFIIADIPQFTFHYAKWRFIGNKRVKTVTITPSDKRPLPEHDIYDVIFICQVFEHLQNPRETASYLHSKLKQGGILIFDYFKSDGTGLDTAAGVAQRDETLRFIGDNFQVISGVLDPAIDFGTIIARKH